MAATLAADPVLALAEPDARQDPAAAYARLRAAGTWWHESLRTWVVADHATAVTVLRDAGRFASDWRRVGEDVPPQAISIQTLDLPEHADVRRLLLAGFRELDYGTLRERLERRVLDRLLELAPGPFDLVGRLAEPVALATVCDVLGVEVPDVAWFVPVAEAIVDGMDAGVWPRLAGPAMAARAELAAYTERWVDDPPPAGLVGGVVRQAAGSGVSHQVLLNTFRVLLHAGYTSASKLLGLAAATLLRQSLLPALRGADDAEARTAVEELARLESPVRVLARACVRDTVLSGARVRVGDPVTVLVGAANRDPARFTDPDRPRLDRSPNPHLGFGRGLHSCLGAPLAALQARVLFAAIAEHFPAATPVAAPVYRRNLTLRGVASFEVALR